MANLTPVSTFSDVRQLETTDLVLAGPGQTMNEQAQALLNRTEYLNDARVAQVAQITALQQFDTDSQNGFDQDLGAAIFGRSSVSIESIHALLSAKQDATQTLLVQSYHDGWAASTDQVVGGGSFGWDADRPKSDHNGGTVISPTVPWNGSQATLSAFLDGAGETNPAGFGCWVRLDKKPDYTTWFGARCNDFDDDHAAIQKAVEVSKSVFHPGMSRISQTIILTENRWSFRGTPGKSGLRVTGNFGALAPSATFFAEIGTVYGVTFTSTAEGVGRGIEGAIDTYFSHWSIVECSFEKQLRFGIAANLIGCLIDRCDFGVYGSSPSAAHQAIRLEGEPWLSAAALTTNANTISNCWIANSKGVNHVIEVVNGMSPKILNNVIEQCTPTVSTIHFIGCTNPAVRDNWLESSNGTTFIKNDLDTDTSLVDQRTIEVQGNLFSSRTDLTPTSVVQFTGTNKRLMFKANRHVGDITYLVTGADTIFTERSGNDFTGADAFALGFRINDPAFFWGLSGEQAYDPPSIPGNSQAASITIAVPGAVMGDFVVGSFSIALGGIQILAYVDSPGVVRVIFQNNGTSTVDLAAGTVYVRVIKRI